MVMPTSWLCVFKFLSNLALNEWVVSKVRRCGEEQPFALCLLPTEIDFLGILEISKRR